MKMLGIWSWGQFECFHPRRKAWILECEFPGKTLARKGLFFWNDLQNHDHQQWQTWCDLNHAWKVNCSNKIVLEGIHLMIPDSCLFKMQLHGSNIFEGLVMEEWEAFLYLDLVKHTSDIVPHLKKRWGFSDLKKGWGIQGSRGALVVKVPMHLEISYFFQTQNMGVVSASSRIGGQNQTS